MKHEEFAKSRLLQAANNKKNLKKAKRDSRNSEAETSLLGERWSRSSCSSKKQLKMMKYQPTYSKDVMATSTSSKRKDSQRRAEQKSSAQMENV
uniref:Uncharacterized protein n=1 Tax=Caenorhabditis japonica TaxID=281687 RepID=A0A8R1I308_CAEJA